MKRIFLGPIWHWLIVVLLCGLGWWAGSLRLHVTSFNTFIIVLLVVAVAALVVVLATSRPGAQVTRDPLEDENTP